MHDQLAIYCCRCNMSIKASSLTSLLPKSERCRQKSHNPLSMAIIYDQYSVVSGYPKIREEEYQYFACKCGQVAFANKCPGDIG